MDETVSLDRLVRRLAGGSATDADRQALKDAVAADRLSLATGTRAVAVGGSVTDMVIVTGDHNFVFKDGDAAALRQAFLSLYPARLHQLPADLPDFTGRGQEVERLLHLFLESSGQAVISALEGMGGVGKTALAVHVAHKLAIHYPEAQLVVDLKGTSEAPLTPAAAMGRLITAFEPQARLPEQVSEVAALYHSLLAGRRILLLLDNAKDAAQIRDLLPDPPAAALITSRRIIVLPGLTPFNLDVLSKSEAMYLLCTILGEGRATEEKLAPLAASCGRLPLALRAAGSFLKGHADWSVGEYLKALASEQERLRRLKHEDIEVEAVLGLSAAMLARENPEWAGRWQMLTVFPGSFDRQAAAAAWQVDEAEARDTLGKLLARSLVLYDADDKRYRLHDLMRVVAHNAFAYGEAAPDAAADRKRLGNAAARHAFHYVKILTEARDLYLKGGESLAHGLQLFDREWDNIRAGQAWAADHTEANQSTAELCCAYADAGGYLLLLRMRPVECIAWHEPALDTARHLKKDHTAESKYLGRLLNMGNAYYFLEKFHRAIEYYEQYLSIARKSGDLKGEGSSLCNLGNVYDSLGEYQRAIDYYEQHLAIARKSGDRQGEGNALGNLGSTWINMNEYHRAIEYINQALISFREIGDRKGEGEALHNLGRVHDALAEHRRAIEFYDQALAIARKLGDRRGEENALGSLGNAYFLLKEYRRAIEFYEQSLALAREVGNRRWEGSALGSLGNVCNMVGEYQRAMELYAQDLLIAREIGDRQGVGSVLANISLVLASLGEWGQAIKLAEKALEILEQIESPLANVVRQNLAKWRRET